MKTVVIIVIAVVISVVAVLGVLIGIGAYQQAQLEKEQKEGNQAFINLMKKVAESEQKQSTPQPVQPIPSLPSQNCSGTAGCFTGQVTRVIDGDTVVVNDVHVRFALSSAPELSEKGGIEAKNFIESLCPDGATALVDEDDGQTGGSYGRTVAELYCNNQLVNSALLEKGLGTIDKRFCGVSEFASEDWAKKYGCTQTVQTKENNCDPSYPDVCIPPSPPDLDCNQIQYRNFKVLPPDPHGFDGDKDGIGCEK